MAQLSSDNRVVEHVRSRPNDDYSDRYVVAACIQCNNRKGATQADDYVRALYRDGFPNDGEFLQRIAMVAKVAAGDLRPPRLTPSVGRLEPSGRSE